MPSTDRCRGYHPLNPPIAGPLPIAGRFRDTAGCATLSASRPDPRVSPSSHGNAIWGSADCITSEPSRCFLFQGGCVPHACAWRERMVHIRLPGFLMRLGGLMRPLRYRWRAQFLDGSLSGGWLSSRENLLSVNSRWQFSPQGWHRDGDFKPLYCRTEHCMAWQGIIGSHPRSPPVPLPPHQFLQVLTALSFPPEPTIFPSAAQSTA